ncbi:MAG: hypothetical protein AAF564_25565 [Bacteroidota bacterium]
MRLILAFFLAFLYTIPAQAQSADEVIPWYDAEADSMVWLSVDEFQDFLESQGGGY